MVVACRYWYELTDGFWGQMVLSQIPHLHAKDILPKDCQHLVCMENFAGMLEYLYLGYGSTKAQFGQRRCRVQYKGPATDHRARRQYHPCCSVRRRAAVFQNSRLAYQYLMHIARSDLKYRGFRDDRMASFEYKQEANFLLYQRVLTADVHEYELLRQSWDTTTDRSILAGNGATSRPKHCDSSKWAYRTMTKTSSATEDARWMYIQGPPGSGKTLVLLEMAIRCARKGYASSSYARLAPTCTSSKVSSRSSTASKKSPSTPSRACSSISAPGLTRRSLGPAFSPSTYRRITMRRGFPV